MTTATSYPVEPGVVTVEGADAMSFLQSMLSQDLDTVAAGASAPALLLQPQGKLVATMHALHVGDDAWWCITDAEGAPALAEGLNRFRIRVKAEINDASADFGRIAVPRRRRLRCRALGDQRRRATDRDRLGTRHRRTACRRRTRTGIARGCGRGRGQPRRLRSRTHRGRCASPRCRRRRADDPAGSVPRRNRGVVHEGLLRRAGARVSHRHPWPGQPVPTASAVRRRAAGGGCRAALRWWRATRSWGSSRAAPGGWHWRWCGARSNRRPT